MEVIVESSFEIGTTAQVKDVPAGLFLTEESSSGGGNRIGLRRCGRSPAESSSSVGGSSEFEEEEEDDAVSSRGGWVDSFSSSLEDSLPINFGMEKVESPLNKRRRLIIANKLRRRSSLSSFSIYSKISPNSMPLHALQESDYEAHKYIDDNYNDDNSSKLQEKRRKMTNNNRGFMVQTQSCICLTSFQDDDG